MRERRSGRVYGRRPCTGRKSRLRGAEKYPTTEQGDSLGGVDMTGRGNSTANSSSIFVFFGLQTDQAERHEHRPYRCNNQINYCSHFDLLLLKDHQIKGAG